MFNNLVESDLHTKEHVRRSWFFLGTLATYGVLFMILGVVSIYAYDAHLEEQTNEYIVTFIPPLNASEPQAPRQERAEQPRPANNSSTAPHPAMRTDFIARVSDSTRAPDKPSATASTVPELPSSGDVFRGPTNVDAGTPRGNAGLPTGIGGEGTGKPHVVVNVPEPPPAAAAPTPKPPPKTIVKSSILNGQAVSLPKPLYPQIAKIAKASGTVAVQVLIDETGKVISAQAVSGNPLLRAAAVQAAFQARFTPTYLSQQPVKVSGVITYNFML